ncbi:calcium-binding protein, partial [Chromobacterium violaceum]|uniref:calcium-binding protein n=1 Tax=Chromobacterium violaceum TaxID=536 RepID=UPI000AD28E3B
MTDLFREMNADHAEDGLILGTDGDDVLTSAGPAWGTQTIRGGAGNDQLTSQGGARAVLEGGDGNDVLANEFGEEAILEGGKGDDTLKGGGHRDTFVFNLGDGKDLIQSYSPQYGSMHESTLRFGAGIGQSDLTASQSGNDLLLQHANGQDSVRVQGWFDPQKRDEMKLSQVVFADGTSWSREQLDNMARGLILGTDGDDVLTSAGPAWGTQTIRGGAGNDQLTSQGGARAVLEGGDGNDVLANEFGEEAILEGGKGDDTLKGGGHRDTFVFNLGDGKDLIQSYSPQYGSMHESTLRFGAGIAQS